jgi:hypothetical protein
MTVPHRNNVACSATLCPDHHHHSPAEPTGCNFANFAMADLIAGEGSGSTGEHPSRVCSEVDAPFLKSDETLGGVKA